ncbi:MAG: IS4 family transposase [Dysgonomonas sp.]
MDKFTEKTSFEQWFSQINLKLFQKLVKNNQLDYYTKKLNMESFFKLLLFAQLHEIKSLRELSDTLLAEELQSTLGFESISFSQLARRLEKVPTSFFQGLFLDLVSQINKSGLESSIPLKIVDSSTLPLCLSKHEWAEFRKTKSGIKMHLRLVYNENGLSFPDKAVLSNAVEHDSSYLDCFVDDPTYMYVFDRGYLDYDYFAKLTNEGYFFTTRLKSNSITRVLESMELPKDTTVLSDEKIELGPKNKSAQPIYRLVKVLGTNGKELRLITNDFEKTADEIAVIYKKRWEIELFFKWMKQHLNIKKFYGQSEQAVHNQVFIAMIVYCLNILAKVTTKSEKSCLQISRYLKAVIWKPVKIWLENIIGRSVP